MKPFFTHAIYYLYTDIGTIRVAYSTDIANRAMYYSIEVGETYNFIIYGDMRAALIRPVDT